MESLPLGWLCILVVLIALITADCTQSQHDQFLDWLGQSGAKIDGVAVTDFVDGVPISSVGSCNEDGLDCYRGVVATHDIPEDTTVIAVPLEIALYDFDGAAHQLEPYPESIPETRLAARLCRERSSGQASTLSAYLDVLPQAIPTPLFYLGGEAELVSLLPGYAGVQEFWSWARTEYEKSSQEALGGASFETFKWAFANVLSRTFEYRVLLGNPGEEVESTIVLMVPFADMVNHNPDNQLAWHLDDSGEWFRLVTTREVKKGEEVFVTYGRKTNEQWWLYYGYIPPKNPADSMTLFNSLEGAAQWYTQSYSAAETSSKYEPVNRAIAAALETAKSADGVERSLAEAHVTLAEGMPSDRRLQVLFATLWKHFQSEKDLGYNCARVVSIWKCRKRSECERRARRAADRAMAHLYRSLLDKLDTSLAAVQRRREALPGSDSLVHTNLHILEMYISSREKILRNVLLASSGSQLDTRQEVDWEL